MQRKTRFTGKSQLKGQKDNYAKSLYFASNRKQKNLFAPLHTYSSSLTLSNQLLLTTFCLLLLSSAVIAEGSKIKFTHDRFSGKTPGSAEGLQSTDHIEAEIKPTSLEKSSIVKSSDLVSLNFTKAGITIGSDCQVELLSSDCRIDAVQELGTIAVRTTRTKERMSLVGKESDSPKYTVGHGGFLRDRQHVTISTFSEGCPASKTQFIYFQDPNEDRLTASHDSPSSISGDTKQPIDHIEAKVISKSKDQAAPKLGSTDRTVQFVLSRGAMSVSVASQQLSDHKDLKITATEEGDTITIQATISQGTDITFPKAADPRAGYGCGKDEKTWNCQQSTDQKKQEPAKKYQFTYSAQQKESELTFSTDSSTTKMTL